MKNSQTQKLLAFLSKNKKTPFTANKLASTFKMPRKSVYNRLSEFRLDGMKMKIGTTTVKGKTVNTYSLVG